MNRILTAAVLCLVLTAPALADGKIYVQLPDLSSYEGERGEEFLYQLVLGNVVASNCVGYEITEEEWSLMVDSADLLTYELGLSTDDYIDNFETPAFAALDQPDTCETVGPAVQPLIDELVNLGGSREALPDQDKAYEDYQAMRAVWDGEAAAAGGKTKVN